MADKANTKTKEAARKRLPSDVRRLEFISKAVEFFAEEGFESSTRELAKRLGVTQPLLYRYFPSKDDLISEVYDTVYVSRWQEEWEGLIADRNQPLEDRLATFYNAYTDVIFRPDWIRIYLYSGLKGVDINRRYMKLVRQKILEPIIAECRHMADLSPRPATDREIEFAWVMHGGIFYYGVIKLVYEQTEPTGKSKAIEMTIGAFIQGLLKEFEKAQ